MDLVDEQDRPAAEAAPRLFGFRHDGADFLDAGQHRAERDEVRAGDVRDQARQRRLAGAGRAPQNDRLQLIAIDGEPERPSRPDQRVLADELVERARPHALGQRRGCLAMPRSAGWIVKERHGRRGLTLSRRFVDHQRCRNRHVQRFDRRLHRNRQALVGGVDEMRAIPLPRRRAGWRRARADHSPAAVCRHARPSRKDPKSSASCQRRSPQAAIAGPRAAAETCCPSRRAAPSTRTDPRFARCR